MVLRSISMLYIMRIAFLSVLFMLFGVDGKTQSVSPEVVASSGNYFENANASIAWTIGEPVIATYTGSQNILTQGFHQTQLEVVSVERIPNAHAVLVYPNPVASQLTVTTEGGAYTKATIHNSLGQIVWEQNWKLAPPSFAIDMSRFANGYYHLQLYDEGQAAYGFKILKQH